MKAQKNQYKKCQSYIKIALILKTLSKIYIKVLKLQAYT